MIRSAGILSKPITALRTSNEACKSCVNSADDEIRHKNDVSGSYNERGQPEPPIRINPTDNKRIGRQASGIKYVKQKLTPCESPIVLPIRDERLTVWLLCGYHVPPNDPKLSDGRGWRDRCVAGERRRPEAAGVTAAPVRCSAWLGVAVIVSLSVTIRAIL